MTINVCIFVGRFFNEDGKIRIVIHKIGMEDAGKYMCQADDKSTSCWLEIEG